jgi:hypothetical protein
MGAGRKVEKEFLRKTVEPEGNSWFCTVSLMAGLAGRKWF